MSGYTQTKPRPPVPVPDVLHARIAREAQAARSNTERAVSDASCYPALGDLLESASKALENRVPATFVHAGKTYYLRVSLGMVGIKVYAKKTDTVPMSTGLAGSCAEFGHTPKK